jgi:ketosteroid isomerase-like protein
MRSISVCVLLLAIATTLSGSPKSNGREGVEAFNKALDTATRTMNNAAIMALWEEEGVSLLPSTPPIVGRKAISNFLDKVTAQVPGAKMELFEMQCHDIQVSGDWASEWCSEHQVVKFPDDKPKFDGWGKMLFALHRGADGQWRIMEEMWNQGLSTEHVH